MTSWLKYYVEENFEDLRIVGVQQDTDKVKVTLTPKQRDNFTFDYTISLRDNNESSMHQTSEV